MAGRARRSEHQSLVALYELAAQLLTLDADPARSDDEITSARARTLAAYRQYVRRFGPLNRGELREGRDDPETGRPTVRWHRPSLDGFRQHPGYHTVMALETYDSSAGGTGVAEPAPILHRRVHGSLAAGRPANTPFEALVTACGRRTTSADAVDLEWIAHRLRVSGPAAAEQALGELVFRDPARGGVCVPVWEYLAGDVRTRLTLARDAAELDTSYTRNVEALIEVVPPKLGPTEIDLSLGSPIVSPADVEAFVHDELGGRVKAWHLPSAAWWKIVPTGRIPRSRYDSGRLAAYDILAAGLNGRLPVVVDSLPGPVPGRRVKRRNAAESLAAQDRLSAMQERFRSWVWEDAARAARLSADYNARFNSHVPPPDLGASLTFPDLAAGVELWPWQREVVARIVSSPATLCAHAVGAGKTISMIGAAVTSRRLGLAAKPLVVVPAHLVEQVAREARQAFPAGRFLVLGESHGPTAAVVARCATGDWDAVIVSHGVFGSLPVSPVTERADLEARIARTETELASGAGGRHGRSVLNRRRTALLDRLDHLARRAAPSLTFDRLGVDLLLVDEAHYFKRLPLTSRREGIALGSSRRAADLALKVRILRARRGRLPSLGLFTGTPWSNTIAESFVWQTLIQPEVLAEAGIEHFDAWAAVFVEYETAVEVSPDSAGMRVMQRPSRVRNLPELVRMLRRSAVVLPPAELPLGRPDRRDDTVVCEPGRRQLTYLRSLAARADKIRREMVRGAPGEDNMLALCTDGRRAALDPRLVGVDENSPKLDAVADRVSRIHRECADLSFPGSDVRGAFQIVFCDQGTPGAGGPQSYGRLRVALAARGVPAERIRWVHDARTPAARTSLYAECRAGLVSVLIGSTDTLGTGANVQTRLRAIHHADAPWRPSDVEQREGRALRPGNANDQVEVVRYVTRGSFDGYMWQTLERKARFIDELRRGHVTDRGVDDLGDTVLSYAEVKALAVGNPLLIEHAQLSGEVTRLRILRAISRQAVTAARAALADADQDGYRQRQRVRMLRSAAVHLTDAPGAGLTAAVREVGARMRQPADERPPGPVRVPWRSLGVELFPVGGWRAPRPDDLCVRVTLAHRPVDELTVSSAAARRRPAVVSEALDDWVERLPESITAAEKAVVDAEETAADASRLLAGYGFEHAEALADAEARLESIKVALEAGVDEFDGFDPLASSSDDDENAA